MHRKLLVIAAAVLATLALAAPSLAATPVPLGTQGGTPDVAVDENGRAHIVWDDDSATFPDVVNYCQLARGGSACQNPETFSGSPGSIFGRPHAFAPNLFEVSVFYQRCCGGARGHSRALFAGQRTQLRR